MELKLFEESDIDSIKEMLEDDNMVFNKENLLRFLSEKNSLGFIVKDSLKTVGFAYAYSLTRPDGKVMLYLHSVGILPSYQNKGVGTSLLTFLSNYAKLNGYSEMFVITDRSNTRACHIYEKTGGKNDIENEIVYVYDFLKENIKCDECFKKHSGLNHCPYVLDIDEKKNKKNANMKNNDVELWDVLNRNGRLTGNTQERGWLNSGNYHLVVHVWIKNKQGQFLISKRTTNKRWPNMWACTIGSAVAGDSSLDTALKESFEELGIILKKENGVLYKSYRRDFSDTSGEFIDVWLFDAEVNISDICLQKTETCDAKWATKEEIQKMIKEGIFLKPEDEAIPYIDDLFSYVVK